MKSQFYITLPSNSSMQVFPDNRTCCFTTQLPRSIELSGEWEVAIVEIQYPLTYLENIINPTPKNQIKRETKTVSDLPDEDTILRATEKPGPVPTSTRNLYVKNILRTDAIVVHSTKGQPEPCPKPEKSIVETTTSLMFVYCDIIEPRIVGDVYAPLLRVLQLRQSGEYGYTEVKTFSPPHYLPLLLSSFRTIEISIRDHQGKSIPFDHGTLTVTLHFRRVQ